MEPFGFGKTMKNDFQEKIEWEPLTISILPTLLVTALSRGSLKRISPLLFKYGDNYWIGKGEDSLVLNMLNTFDI